MAGIHVDVEEPVSPDFVLYNDGTWTPQEQVKKLIEAFVPDLPAE